MSVPVNLSAREAAQLEAMLPQPATQDLRDVALALLDGLLTEGVPQDAAVRYAAACTRHLSAQLGGQQVYIPRCLLAQLSERNARIFSAFQGNNYRELARRFHLTEQRVRRIVATEQAADMQRRQGRLFE